jgi:NSS family neurotransmitter:Na+ symporter
LLPANGLLIALFSGWIMTRQTMFEELGLKHELLFRYLRFVLRYVAPVVIGMIFYTSLA